MDTRPAVFNYSGARIPTSDFERGTILDIKNKGDKTFRLIVLGQKSRWLLVSEIDKQHIPIGVAQVISPNKQRFEEIYVGEPLILVFFENHRVDYLYQIVSVKVYQDDTIASPRVLEWADDLVPMVVNSDRLPEGMKQRLEELKKTRDRILA